MYHIEKEDLKLTNQPDKGDCSKAGGQTHQNRRYQNDHIFRGLIFVKQVPERGDCLANWFASG